MGLIFILSSGVGQANTYPTQTKIVSIDNDVGTELTTLTTLEVEKFENVCTVAEAPGMVYKTIAPETLDGLNPAPRIEVLTKEATQMHQPRIRGSDLKARAGEPINLRGFVNSFNRFDNYTA